MQKSLFNIIQLFEDERLVTVINRKTKSRYRITYAWYTRHRDKYILIPPRKLHKKTEYNTADDDITNTNIDTAPQSNQQMVDNEEYITIEKDTIDISDENLQSLEKYSSRYNLKILFLNEPHYAVPKELQTTQYDLKYMCTIKDQNYKDVKVFIDVYYNKKQEDINTPEIIQVSNENYKIKTVTENEDIQYFKIALRIYKYIFKDNIKENLFVVKDDKIKILNEWRGSIIKQDLLPGGIGDTTDPDTLDQKQLEVGILVQMQHTNNKR